ncbi:MAG: glycine--tRNA ligase subunit beta [Hyphomonadaceae bacterium]
MAQLLLELFSEEIPARMQAKAEADLGKALGDALKGAGLDFEALETLSGPRRLTVIVDGLPAKSADVRDERKGPKVGAPEKAVEGFMRGAGLASIDEAEIRTDPKKGDFYVAIVEKQGQATADIIAAAVPEIVRKFHWPKSMRWGTGDLRWVRPLQRIVCVFDGAIVPFEIDGLASGNETEGHRVHGRGPYVVTGWDDYKAQLEGAGHVKLTREDRRALIETEAKALCEKAGLELVEDEGLLQEVTGLAEWPVPVLGAMDPAFLDLPPEVVRLSMRTHQKYFAVRDPKTGALAPNFVTVANIQAADGGAKIAAGNAKVLSARLDDARFFWDNDKKTGLDDMLPKLAKIDFKKELGSIADKVKRVAALARELAPKVGANPDMAERAAKLAKADLVSEMVYEFPELQGVMGRYYALEAGEDASVAGAIADHYQPQGPSNPVPTDPVSIAVALADKLDTLVGFWAIGEKPAIFVDEYAVDGLADVSSQMTETPTGSKDPFALRRAALGVVRILLENEVRISFRSQIDPHFNLVGEDLPAYYKIGGEIVEIGQGKDIPKFRDYMMRFRADQAVAGNDLGGRPTIEHSLRPLIEVPSDLLQFLADRLKQHLKDQGERHDLIDAVFALGEDDLVLITKRVSALGTFLETEDGTNLLAGYKRATNILKAEEKKTGETYTGSVNPDLLKEKPEQDLHSDLTKAVAKVEAALGTESFDKAMAAMAPLRGALDTFFDHVTVNDENADVRRNRLLLLASMRDALTKVANFSKIEG